MVRVFLVLPDLSGAKAAALRAASRLVGPVDVLVSASTLAWKPGVEARLASLRLEPGVLGLVMLDSGAYHHARGAARVGVEWYAGLAARLATGGLADLVVAPDVPGDPEETLRRTLEFAPAYPGQFVPVAQPPRGPPDPAGHARQLDSLARHGLLERAPRLPGGRVLVGLGGLDGPRRRTAYLAGLLGVVEGEWPGVALHLFGAGARHLRALARRGLLHMIYSVDSTGWLAEIRYRRRTVYNAASVEEANASAIIGYLGRARAATGEAIAGS